MQKKLRIRGVIFCTIFAPSVFCTIFRVDILNKILHKKVKNGGVLHKK